MRPSACFTLASLLVLVGAERLRAEPAATTVADGGPERGTVTVSARRVYDLERCLRLAARNTPRIQEAKARLSKRRAERQRSRVQPYDNFDLSAGVALAPTARGNSLYSSDVDVALDSEMALGWQVGMSGAIPLWTFGKIESLWDAADAGVAVGEQEVRKAKNEVLLDVRRAYYGLQFARDALALARDAQRQVERYVRALERRVAEGEGDDIALLKLKVQRAELVAKSSEARKQAANALAGLRFLTGVGEALDIPDEPLTRVRHPLGPLARYLEAARLHRPEVNMARAGIAARRAQLRLEEARAYPDLAVGVEWRWSRAPERDDQRNPFVSDSANRLGFGVGLGLKWSLDLLTTSAKIAAARAELEVARATERFALGGVGVEVEAAYADAADAARRLDAYRDATRFAKQWLVKVQQGIDIGTYEEEDLVDPAKEYALQRLSLMAATFDYNVAMARLALTIGWDPAAAAGDSR